MIKEDDLLQKIKIKLKTKPVTSLQSKGNSKTNIRCGDSINSSRKKSKQTISTTNTNINNKIIHNTKKIFINNIINVNANNEANIDDNCLSYRLMGSDKIQSLKHQIINIPSRTPCLDNTYTNKSQKNICQNQINKTKQPIKEVIITKK